MQLLTRSLQFPNQTKSNFQIDWTMWLAGLVLQPNLVGRFSYIETKFSIAAIPRVPFYISQGPRTPRSLRNTTKLQSQVNETQSQNHEDSKLTCTVTGGIQRCSTSFDIPSLTLAIETHRKNLSVLFFYVPAEARVAAQNNAWNARTEMWVTSITRYWKYSRRSVA